MIKAYDISALIGNVGGFIGLFLGYALMMIPDLLRTIILRFRIRTNTETLDMDKSTIIENGELNEIKQKLDHLSNIISHVQDEVTSYKMEMS